MSEGLAGGLSSAPCVCLVTLCVTSLRDRTLSVASRWQSAAPRGGWGGWGGVLPPNDTSRLSFLAANAESATSCCSGVRFQCVRGVCSELCPPRVPQRAASGSFPPSSSSSPSSPSTAPTPSSTGKTAALLPGGFCLPQVMVCVCLSVTEAPPSLPTAAGRCAGAG